MADLPVNEIVGIIATVQVEISKKDLTDDNAILYNTGG